MPSSNPPKKKLLYATEKKPKWLFSIKMKYLMFIFMTQCYGLGNQEKLFFCFVIDQLGRKETDCGHGSIKSECKQTQLS